MPVLSSIVWNSIHAPTATQATLLYQLQTHANMLQPATESSPFNAQTITYHASVIQRPIEKCGRVLVANYKSTQLKTHTKKMNVHNVRSLQPITYCKKVRGMSYESANVVIEMIRSWSTSKLSWWHSTCTLNAKHYMYALYNYTYIYIPICNCKERTCTLPPRQFGGALWSNQIQY